MNDPVTQNAAWPVEYTYANSNLTKKTDSRNISINIGYDTLNRPITRTYSDSTPPVDYIYDGARVTNGIANSKGRMTSVLTSSPFSSSYTYDSFDEMGRVLHTTETVESNPAYTMSYQYNLAGALTSETYPSSKTYATSYDIAGRIAVVTGPSNKVYGERLASFFHCHQIYSWSGRHAFLACCLSQGCKSTTLRFDFLNSYAVAKSKQSEEADAVIHSVLSSPYAPTSPQPSCQSSSIPPFLDANRRVVGFRLPCERQLALARISVVKPRTAAGVKQDDKAHP